MGLSQMVFYAGLSLGPILGGALADVVGIRSCFVAAGVLLALAGVMIRLSVREHFHPEVRTGEGTRGFVREQIKLVFRSHPLVTALGIRMSMVTSARMIVPVLPLFVQSLMGVAGNAPTVTGLVMGGNGIGSCLGSLGSGQVSDRVGFRLVLIVCSAVAAASCIAQAVSIQAWQVLAMQAAMGVAIGAMEATLSASLANLAPKGAAGAVFGVDTSAIALPSAVAPLAGAGMAATLGLRSAFLGSGALLGLAGLGVAKWLPRIRDGT
jgi:DHA1 family multidrug resistance protein-like MFS transporter